MSKNKINRKLILYRVLTTIIMWVVIIAGDIIDEMLIELDLLANRIAVFLPLLLICITIKHILKRKHTKNIRKKVLKRYLVYIASYNLSFFLIWYIIQFAVDNDTFFITQHYRGYLCFNGIEYTIYIWTAVVLFDVVIAVFAIIYLIVKFIKITVNNKMNKEE